MKKLSIVFCAISLAFNAVAFAQTKKQQKAETSFDKQDNIEVLTSPSINKAKMTALQSCAFQLAETYSQKMQSSVVESREKEDTEHTEFLQKPWVIYVLNPDAKKAFDQKKPFISSLRISFTSALHLPDNTIAKGNFLSVDVFYKNKTYTIRGKFNTMYEGNAIKRIGIAEYDIRMLKKISLEELRQDLTKNRLRFLMMDFADNVAVSIFSCAHKPETNVNLKPYVRVGFSH